MSFEIEKKIYEMLTENTGTHFLDSGGANGRMWQRNQKKTIEDFQDEPTATVELEWWRENDAWLSLDVSTFHYLTSVLSLDLYCAEFNARPCKNWDSENFYGVSDEGESWLLDLFEIKGSSWNSYNWDCPLSQVLQGCELTHIETGDTYVLLQVHGGADVRGGYTDAQLFKVECEYFLDVGCFWEVDFMGEWLNHEGQSIDTDDIIEIAKKYEMKIGDSKSFEADLYYCGM